MLTVVIVVVAAVICVACFLIGRTLESMAADLREVNGASRKPFVNPLMCDLAYAVLVVAGVVFWLIR